MPLLYLPIFSIIMEEKEQEAKNQLGPMESEIESGVKKLYRAKTIASELLKLNVNFHCDSSSSYSF